MVTTAYPKREKRPDDLKELCRAGKLFAVQQWIREGRPSRMPVGSFATSPVQIAIERGFHSLVEVLLQGNVLSQEEKDDALRRAFEGRNLDLVELLVQNGAAQGARCRPEARPVCGSVQSEA